MAELDAVSVGVPPVAQIVDVMETVQSRRTPEFTAGLADPGLPERFLAANLGSTTHGSVLDGDGRARSVTFTNGEGSGVVGAGTGIPVNNIMGEGDPSPPGVF